MAKETKMLVPTEKQFSLAKAKVVPDGGLIVHYEVTEVVGEESYTNKYHVESAKEIHPDLKDLFKKLVPIMGRIYSATSFLSMLDVKDFKATEKQKEFARDFAEQILKTIEVRGVNLSGSDDNIGVILTGVKTLANNQKVAINSARMKLNSESYGFETELEEIVAEIETEVYAFLFKGKKAQLELFGASNEPTDDAVNENETNDENNDLFPNVADPAENDLENDLENDDGSNDF